VRGIANRALARALEARCVTRDRGFRLGRSEATHAHRCSGQQRLLKVPTLEVTLAPSVAMSLL
jgi:hypothetical protein